jgi:hypothetical protein
MVPFVPDETGMSYIVLCLLVFPTSLGISIVLGRALRWARQGDAR